MPTLASFMRACCSGSTHTCAPLPQVLTWTLFALMQQPEVERKLLAELDAEVGDEAVSAPLPPLSPGKGVRFKGLTLQGLGC